MDATIFFKSHLNEYLQQRFRFNPEIEYEYEPLGPPEDRYWIAKNPKIYDLQKQILFEFEIKSKPFKKQKQAEQYLSPIILKLIEEK